jgi:hypothetical protein
MDALMRVMRQLHYDPMNTSMFDAKAYMRLRGACESGWGLARRYIFRDSAIEA